ncbi:hypothetical protein E2542_SST07766 [Spatholobus suberectus]|nr:hypothetical protein E2542_SST07766 [Spatholobus suberectus]
MDQLRAHSWTLHEGGYINIEDVEQREPERTKHQQENNITSGDIQSIGLVAGSQQIIAGDAKDLKWPSGMRYTGAKV